MLHFARAWKTLSIALVILLVAGCGGGGGGGGGGGAIQINVVNQTTDAVLTRIEYLDATTEQLVAAADFSASSGETWTGFLDLPLGSYWRVLYGIDLTTGGPCMNDDRINAAQFGDPSFFITLVEPGDTSLTEIFQGFFCDVP